MKDEIVLKINRKSQDAQLLIAHLMALPYVEIQEDEIPNDFNLPVFCPKNYDELKQHVSNIERNLSNNRKLIDNEEVMNNTKEILKRYIKKRIGDR